MGPEYGLHADGYHLSEIQAQRILEMQLQRLTNLESDKIIGEYKEIMAKIADLLDILATPARITQIIRDELKQIQEQFGDARRSVIVENAQDMSMEDLTKPEEMVVTLSRRLHEGAADGLLPRGSAARGKQAAGTRTKTSSEDVRRQHPRFHPLLLNRGRMYWLRFTTSWLAAYRRVQTHRQPVATGRRREDQCIAAGQIISRRALCLHGDQQRHRQENPAVRLLACLRASSRWDWTKAISDRRVDHRRLSRRDAVLRRR